MAFSANLRKGTDIPTWDWLSFFPQGPTYHGTSHAWDGTRYLYWLSQTGSTGAASTTTLWRYDTYSDAWQYLATTTNSYLGVDLEHDPVRNVLIMTTGNNTTEWRVFNLNQTSVTMLGQTIFSATPGAVSPSMTGGFSVTPRRSSSRPTISA